MIACIAVNNIGFIGKDNDLMWRCSKDLKHFKVLTKDKVMLIGYNTYQTLPNVVKKRDIVLDGRGEPLQNVQRFNFDHPSQEEKNKIEAEGKKPVYQGKDIICIGGKKTYEKYCHMFTELHISHINDNQIGDCTFPDLSNLNPDCKIFNYSFETNIKY